MRRIAIIPGDGIGADITAEAVKVLGAVLERSGLEMAFDTFDFGADQYLNDEIALPSDQVEMIRRDYSAVFLGALGDPRLPDHRHAREIILGLIHGLGLHLFCRPVSLLNERFCPLKDKHPEQIDFILFGDCIEGLVTRVSGFYQRGTADEISYSQSILTRKGVERIIRHAFEYTRLHGRKKLTLASRLNSVFSEDDLWERAFQEIGAEYSGIETSELTVCNLMTQLLKSPENFEVIVTGNSYCHLLSEIGAQLQGGAGLAASAYLNPGKISLFTPALGFCLKPSGSNTANPLGAIASAALMLESLGFEQEARWINQAVRYTLETNNVTRDLGGRLSTNQVGDFIANQIRKGIC